jgi:hypothetical protein
MWWPGQCWVGSVLARAEVGKSFIEAVVHGDQLAVDQKVDVALVGSDAGGGLGDDLGPGQGEADLGCWYADRRPKRSSINPAPEPEPPQQPDQVRAAFVGSAACAASADRWGQGRPERASLR